jgi:hypothetical protein
MELRDTPEGLWQKGHSPGPLSVKQTNLFLRSVIGYLHYDKASKVEVCDTNDDMGPQVLLLPTGKAVRFSPEMQKHSEDEARIQQEVEKRVELRTASMQASWLAQNQGQVGPHAQHGEAMPKFPTRPDSNQLAYHAAMVEEAQRDTNSTTFSYDMRARHDALVEEARRDTNSSTFSYDLRDNEAGVQLATAPRSSWSFRDYPGYSDRSRNAEDARQRETQERSRQSAEARQREVEHAEFMQATRTEERQREADRASMMETVVAGVVAGIKAQSQRTTTVSRSAANAAVQTRLTGSITSLLGDIPTKGEGIDTDSLKWDTYLTAWIMAT